MHMMQKFCKPRTSLMNPRGWNHQDSCNDMSSRMSAAVSADDLFCALRLWCCTEHDKQSTCTGAVTAQQ